MKRAQKPGIYTTEEEEGDRWRELLGFWAGADKRLCKTANTWKMARSNCIFARININNMRSGNKIKFSECIVLSLRAWKIDYCTHRIENIM